MTAHRERFEQLRERAEDELDALAFLLEDTAVPALVIELVGELGACVLELEMNEAIGRRGHQNVVTPAEDAAT